jgi:hypothetical protein
MNQINDENTMNSSINIAGKDILSDQGDVATSAMKAADDDSAAASTAVLPDMGEKGSTGQLENRPPDKKGLPVRIQFHVRENGRVLETHVRPTLTIGRHNSTMPVDVDLADFNAIEMGISRNHVRIQPVNDELTVVDLNSVNGTTLNGVPMKPNRAYELRDGDILRVGRLHLKVYFIY